jgi:hypothetical protein
MQEIGKTLHEEKKGLTPTLSKGEGIPLLQWEKPKWFGEANGLGDEAFKPKPSINLIYIFQDFEYFLDVH